MRAVHRCSADVARIKPPRGQAKRGHEERNPSSHPPLIPLFHPLALLLLHQHQQPRQQCPAALLSSRAPPVTRLSAAVHQHVLLLQPLPVPLPACNQRLDEDMHRQTQQGAGRQQGCTLSVKSPPSALTATAGTLPRQAASTVPSVGILPACKATRASSCAANCPCSCCPNPSLPIVRFLLLPLLAKCYKTIREGGGLLCDSGKAACPPP